MHCRKKQLDIVSPGSRQTLTRSISQAQTPAELKMNSNSRDSKFSKLSDATSDIASEMKKISVRDTRESVEVIDLTLSPDPRSTLIPDTDVLMEEDMSSQVMC